MAFKVLIVDDEADIQFLTTQKFRKSIRAGDFECRFASNGLEALEVLAQEKDIAVVVTDLNMPQMGGLSLLKALDEDPDIDADTIVVTAYGDVGQVRAAMNQGARDFLTKPVNYEALEAAIRKAAQGVQSRRDRKSSRVLKPQGRGPDERGAREALRRPLDEALQACARLEDAPLNEAQRKQLRSALELLRALDELR